jgi:hypothetical protein
MRPTLPENIMRTPHPTAIQRAALGMLVSLTLCTPALAQAPPPAKPQSLSGPRFGVTFLSDSIVDKLKDEDIDVSPVITQFGWQFEKLFNTEGSGPMLVTEWVLLAGGVEQGLFLPSLSWLTGVRTRTGLEFGVGPNLSVAGAALVLTAGKTFRVGDVNVPVNLAVVPSKVSWVLYEGPPFRETEIERRAMRVSLLFGFNTRR